MCRFLKKKHDAYRRDKTVLLLTITHFNCVALPGINVKDVHDLGK